jgi:hypothetical protein
MDRLPPRVLPLLYLGFAHAALAVAFAAIAVDPRGVAGFFYHPRMLAIVHLVTLGWITASILGSLYLVAPIALRTQIPAAWPDYTAAALFAIGVIGMVGHFWIAEYGGMAWSGGLVAAAVLVVGGRCAGPLRRAPVPLAVRLHVGLAFFNFAGAATMGVLIGIYKVHAFLPGSLLSDVFAHAQLAAIGWASMMVVGVAYRLLPMVLPARMPSGRRLSASAALLEVGVAGLFFTLLRGSSGAWLWAAVIVAGFAAFGRQVVWMLRHPLPRPPAIRAPDPAVLHAGAALLSLFVAGGLGLWLSVATMSERTLRGAMAYGVLGLVGFLAQMVVAMEGRLLPIHAWYWAFANTGFRGPVPTPHEMPWRPGQLVVVALWWFGLPCLAGGLAFEAVPFVAAGAWSLLAATVLDTLQMALIARHAYARPAVTPRRAADA